MKLISVVSKMDKIGAFVILSLINAIFCSHHHFKPLKTGFYPGRVKPGKFEYTKHNGWMLPRKAIELCENGKI